MKALNRYFGIVWMIFAFLSVWFWLDLQGMATFNKVLNYSGWICLMYLFYNSRSAKSKHAVLLFVGMIILLVGLTFRFFHWSMSQEIILLSSVFIITGYSLFIARRTRRNWIDLLKLGWVASSGIAFLWYMMRLPYIDVIEQVPAFLFWPMYLSVVISEALGKDQSIEEDPEPEGLPNDIL
jgi:hypothetical protein